MVRLHHKDMQGTASLFGHIVAVSLHRKDRYNSPVIRPCYYTHKLLLFTRSYVWASSGYLCTHYMRTHFRLMQLRYLSRTCTHPVRPLACYRSRFALSLLIVCALFRAPFIPICQRSSRLNACTTFCGLRYLHGLRGYARTRLRLRSMCAAVLVNARAFTPLHPVQIIAFLRLRPAIAHGFCASMRPLSHVWARFRPLRLVLLAFHRIAARTKPTNLCAAARPP